MTPADLKEYLDRQYRKSKRFASMRIPLLSACLLVIPICMARESATEGELVSLPAKVDVFEVSAKPEPLDFKVLTSRTQRIYLTQAPPMEGLPPVAGTVALRVEMVKTPELPKPMRSLLGLPVQALEVSEQLQEFREDHPDSQFLFLSATVYANARTLLRVFPNGRSGQEVTVWSNVDFNHFSGIGTFRVKEPGGATHDVGLVMGLGNEPGNAPGMPELPDPTEAGPSFVVVEGTSEESLRAVRRLHQLYWSEGEWMKRSFLARMKAVEAKKAALLANPPKPSDVTVRFWQRPEAAIPQSAQP